MTVHTDWVSPAQEITGRDHLGVQAVSEQLYATLLPGITNVTDRARCYSFYPWFVWKFDQQAKNKTVEELIQVFRRADCLHTLIGINHEIETQNEWTHGGGLVGRDKLVAVTRRVREGKAVRLSQFSELGAATEDRYFKNKLGGLGQYYLGPLKELLVLDGDAKAGLKYTDQWGVTLAKLVDNEVDGSEFFAGVRQDVVTLPMLRSLQSFCPCNLRKNKKERDAIVDLLFCRGQGGSKYENGLERRNTLLLALDYARQVRQSKTPQAAEPDGFLSSAYAHSLSDGAPWEVRPVLHQTIEGWGIYQRHELLAVAVQGLFWAGLGALGDEGGFVRDVESYARWFADRFHAGTGGVSTQRSFMAMLEDRKANQPSLSKWKSKDHELSLADALLDAQKAKDYQQVVALSAQIIVSLLARDCPRPAYGRFQMAERFLQGYEINLASLERLANSIWAAMDTVDWMKWLAANWGLQSHFRVALRKLRHQTQDTFRIVPLDDGLYVREAPTSRWSSPRLPQAFRFLYDLGAVDDWKDGPPGSYVLSDFGERLWEGELGRA